MEISVSLPTSLPAKGVITWARRAEGAGFKILTSGDRMITTDLETLVSFAAVAACTERIELITSVILSPLRANHLAFAREVATLDHFSEGRLTLGLGVGSRAEDYAESGVDFHRRGALMDAQLERITSIWRGMLPEVGPAPYTPGGPPILFGGRAPAVLQRVARWGAGWICPTSGGVEGFTVAKEELAKLWEAESRDRRPRLLANGPRYALGAKAEAAADEAVRAYNAAHATSSVTQTLRPVMTSGEEIREQMAAFAAAGCDVLCLSPAEYEPEQIELLAEAIGL
ncbi:MAG TPA: LLM class flavin-dependent oxidoreductase [Acidimicrobiales bacterium]|nr:LLM class flavin-dependent oxidoreductase [Acidimicrobiales bacterium]